MRAKDKIICSPNSRMISILERLNKIPERRSILLIGPTGTGKELLASYIHENSKRSNKSLTRLNCTGLTDTLIDSQLFGHKKGAFTGANKDHIGYIEKSAGGILFLDEIGNMPNSSQAKLLRVIENGKFQKLGEEIVRDVDDVRFISATNKPEKMIVDLKERFRHHIRVPALRSRPSDIPHLLSHFMVEAGFKSVDLTALLFLSAADLMGNVRELRRFVDEAGISREIMIEKGDLEKGTLQSDTLSFQLYMRHLGQLCKESIRILEHYTMLRKYTTFDRTIEIKYPNALLPFEANVLGIAGDWSIKIDNEAGIATAEEIIDRYKDLLNKNTEEQLLKLIGNPKHEEIGLKDGYEPNSIKTDIHLKMDYMHRPPALRKWDIFRAPWKIAKKRFQRAYIINLLEREHTTDKELYDIANVGKKTWGEWKKKFPGVFDSFEKGNLK